MGQALQVSTTWEGCAVSYHALCDMNEASREAEIEESRMPVHEPPGSEAIISESRSPAPVPTWTPLTATVSGPRFLSPYEADQGTVRKLHNNLGHPTAERLSKDCHVTCQHRGPNKNLS